MAADEQELERLRRELECLRQRVKEFEAERGSRPREVVDSRTALEREASFRRSIIARVAEGLCVCHAVEEYPHVRFTEWNDRMEQITGYAMDEINRLGWYQTVYPDPEVSAAAQARMARMRDGDDLLGEEWEITRADGEKRTVSISSSLLVSADGVGHVLALMQDVTERRRAEIERKRLHEQMLHAQKLESLGVLAGGIAHDFNNLLCGMLGSADLALFDLEPAHPARDSLEMVRDTAQRATELCRQMLAYSGKGRFEVEPLDVSRLIGDMAQLLRVSVAKKASLRFELHPDLPAVAADATQLRQILLNLVVNASDSLGGGSGSITVATGSMQCDRGYLRSAYLHEDLPEGRYVFVEVADTGCGMDEETRLRIFDPFFTTKFAGRGLGLAATLGIVRGHNGTIKVYSEPRAGTTFKVLLPAATQPADRGRQAAPAAPWQGGGVVLLVDDERTVRTIGAKMLERLGFEVLLAEDGLAGVESFRQHADRIDVVILDMTMPGLSGEEAFGELRRIRADVRVLLTSGYNEQEATNRFIGKGLAGFLQKPFQLTTLHEKLRGILESGSRLP